MVVSTVVPAVVPAVMTSIVASVVMTRSLRGMRGVMSGSSTLWTALELQGTPDPALPALRRRVIIGWIVIRDTAALTFVPVEPRGRTITTWWRRGRRGGGPTRGQATALLLVPEFVAFATVLAAISTTVVVVSTVVEGPGSVSSEDGCYCSEDYEKSRETSKDSHF
jgi:hypothetical protein